MLDEHGWASVDELLAGINRTRPQKHAGGKQAKGRPSVFRRDGF